VTPKNLELVQVISSVIAAWSDASQTSASVSGSLGSVTSVITNLNVGYLWMFGNCLTSAAYVRRFNKREAWCSYHTLTGFVNAQENQGDRLL